jgi:hypothetical protein
MMVSSRPSPLRAKIHDPGIGTIVWLYDVDFDPEVLYSHITGQPIPGRISEIAGRGNPGVVKSPK